jgi:hypothetical protein
VDDFSDYALKRPRSYDRGYILKHPAKFTMTEY